MNNVYINNIQRILLNKAILNDEIEDYLGCIAGKKSKVTNIVLRSSGIKQRYYVLEKRSEKSLFTNAQLTAQAIKKLENEFFLLNEVDCLSCGTTTPDQLMPNHTLMVQGELSLCAIETH